MESFKDIRIFDGPEDKLYRLDNGQYPFFKRGYQNSDGSVYREKGYYNKHEE